MSITEKSLLVSLHISDWRGSRLDRGASESLTSAKGANRESARVNKSLLPKAALEGVQTAKNALRTAHYNLTVPWDDSGSRMLAVAGFERYRSEIAELRAEYQAAVAEFVANYATYREQAEEYLGELFSPLDYPHASEIAAKFGASVEFYPLPSGGDLRIDIESETRAEIAREIEAATMAKVSAAARDPLERVIAAVGKLGERLKAVAAHEGEGRAPSLHQSALANVLQLADLLPALNVANDPAIDDLAREIRASFGAYTVDGLKTSPKAQEDASEAVKATLAKVESLTRSASMFA